MAVTRLWAPRTAMSGAAVGTGSDDDGRVHRVQEDVRARGETVTRNPVLPSSRREASDPGCSPITMRCVGVSMTITVAFIRQTRTSFSAGCVMKRKPRTVKLLRTSMYPGITTRTFKLWRPRSSRTPISGLKRDTGVQVLQEEERWRVSRHLFERVREKERKSYIYIEREREREERERDRECRDLSYWARRTRVMDIVFSSS